MLWNTKDGELVLNDARMEYIRFGRGKKTLVMLPGLGDGLRTVKGTALPMALMYRKFAKTFTVYLFSRKSPLPEGCTTRDMARDQAQAMELLGIGKAHIFGVSMGGMVAQWLAIDYPEKVDRLVLAVTSSEPNPILTESIEEWMTLAKAGDTAEFMRSNLRRMYSESYCRKTMWIAPILGWIMKPASYERFFIQARACLSHHASEFLPNIRANTLVIGAGQDKALGGEASEVIASRIPGARLKMYQQWGHAVYEEEKIFNDVLLAFLK